MVSAQLQQEASPPAQTEKERSSLVSRNVTIAGHRTSVRLEPDMWNGLNEICKREHMSMHDICTMVADHKASNTSLTAAIRVFVMAYFRSATTEDGHTRAGHGPGGSYMTSMLQKRLIGAGMTASSLSSNANFTTSRVPGRFMSVVERIR